MKKYYALTVILLLTIVLFCCSCGKGKESKAASDKIKDTSMRDFIVVSESEDTPLIFYNQNYFTSVSEFKRYIETAYDFELSKEIIVENVDAQESVFLEIRDFLDEKEIPYVIVDKAK